MEFDWRKLPARCLLRPFEKVHSREALLRAVSAQIERNLGEEVLRRRRPKPMAAKEEKVVREEPPAVLPKGRWWCVTDFRTCDEW